MGLPFRKGTERQDFFPRLETQYPPHLHQEQAWQRLRTEGKHSTLIATGTGSGKTERFLYPILDHVLNNPSERGIKAIILYPMNALATDQARRFAEEISRNTATKGKVRVGLYVGGKSDESETMSAESVITSRDEMKRNSPDILMTNYKMLDYLLIRPDDKDLWAAGSSEPAEKLICMPPQSEAAPPKKHNLNQHRKHVFNLTEHSSLTQLIRLRKLYSNRTRNPHLFDPNTEPTTQ